MTAKIGDFGLSKQIYEKNYYKKSERNYVPWKWMAFEFLQYGKFQLKSDVWSYGVVIWEIFSLGKSPYGGQSYDEVFDRLNNGYHLPCPENVENILSWPAKQIYEELAAKCFTLEECERSGFPHLVQYIKSKLSAEELQVYDEK